MKDSVRNDKEPSGMSNAGRARFEALITRLGMHPIGRGPTDLGDILIAERKTTADNGEAIWEMAWAARDMMSSLDLPFFTPPKKRISEASEMAYGTMKARDGVERPLH